MPEVKLNLTGEEKKEWVEYYKRKRRYLIYQLNVVDQNLQALDGGENPQLNLQYNFKLDLANYDPHWQWPQKIEFALRQSNRCITTKEIVSILYEFDSKLKEDPSVPVKVASAVSYQNERTLKRYKIYESDKEFQVGLIDWFENETPKEKYKSRKG